MGDSLRVTLLALSCHLIHPALVRCVTVSPQNRVLESDSMRIRNHETPDFHFSRFALFKYRTHKTRADTCGTILIFKE